MHFEMEVEDAIKTREENGSETDLGQYNVAYSEAEFETEDGVSIGYKKTDDSLISSFGKKVPVCSGGCDLEGDEANVRTITDNGKTIKVCIHCADRVRYVSANSVMSKEEAEGIVRPILLCHDLPSNVFRYLDSPWGPIRINISVNSFFAASVILLERVNYPTVGHTSERNAKNHRRMLRLSLSQEGYAPLMIVKRLIDSEFDKALIQEAFKQQNGDWFDFSNFIERLKAIIKAVHLDPLAQTERNTTVDANLASDWGEYDARGARELKAALLEDVAEKV